jgi:hypothetical protein
MALTLLLGPTSFVKLVKWLKMIFSHLPSSPNLKASESYNNTHTHACKHKCISRQTTNKNKRNEKKPKPHKTRRDAYKTQIADKIEGKYNKTTSKKELEISIKRCSNWAGPLSLARVRYVAI